MFQCGWVIPWLGKFYRFFQIAFFQLLGSHYFLINALKYSYDQMNIGNIEDLVVTSNKTEVQHFIELISIYSLHIILSVYMDPANYMIS